MNNQKKNDFWNSADAQMAFRADASEEAALHQHLGELIRRYAPERLLDYGCGDGALLTALEPSLEIGLYDPNTTSMRRAAERSKSSLTRVYDAPTSIPLNYYDVVVFSFVLICLTSKEQFNHILKEIKSFLREGGILIVAEGHPCFRDKHFAGHHVNYTPAAPFNYNSQFHEFNICLHGDDKDVDFYDHHWTLSETLNTIIGAGFAIDEVHEITDSDYLDRKANTLFPPFFVTCAKKIQPSS